MLLREKDKWLQILLFLLVTVAVRKGHYPPKINIISTDCKHVFGPRRTRKHCLHTFHIKRPGRPLGYKLICLLASRAHQRKKVGL